MIRDYGKYGRYWEMRRGGPHAKRHREIFKCSDCGAETVCENGWNGAPDPSNCKPWCRSRSEDWRPGHVTEAYRKNYDAIFRGGGVGSH